MPRKTATATPQGQVNLFRSFNEAAARCRGKPLPEPRASRGVHALQ